MTRTTSPTFAGVPPRTSCIAKLTGLAPDHLLQGQQRVLELVASGAPLRETLTAIAKFSEDTIPHMMAYVLILDPETQSLRKGGYGRLPESCADFVDGLKPGPDVGSCGTAAYRNERVISLDVRTDPKWVHFREFAATYGIISAWSTPLNDSKGNLLGVFGMYYGEIREPSADDLDLVDHFSHLAAIAIDRYRYDAEREHRITHDVLTGLGNRQLLVTTAETLIADSAQDGKVYSLAILDVDHFKLHNNALGQSVADRLLGAIASRLQDGLSDIPLLARFGGDQFIALLPMGTSDARDVIQPVLNAFHAPMELSNASVVVSLSAGIVQWQPRMDSLDEALSQAIEALKAAKELGRDRCVVFGEAERAMITGKRRVVKLLSEALADHRVEPFLQPIVCLQDAQPIGYEVLARLRGPEASDLSPGVFIPIAEENNLIERLGMQVLRFAFRTLAENADVLRGMTMHVNVSTRQLMRDELTRQALAAARDFGLSPDRIVLEVTESHWLDIDSPAKTSLLHLHESGFRLALDDFGTGYASLSQLQNIPFDFVKIDRSFTTQLTSGARGRALCDAALTMATACNMKVTAEGVEMEEQAQILKELGFHCGQGYLWAKPMPVDTALAWHTPRQLPMLLSGSK